MPQYDPVARKVYVNLQEQNIFAVIDPVTDEIVGRYPVGRCKGNHGMTLDPEHHRAFLACEENLLTVFDLDKHEPIAFLQLPDGVDVIKFDPGLHRIYAASYSGAISVVQQDDPNHYRKIEDFKAQHAVHTLAVDVETHRVYTPEQEENGKPVARNSFQHQPDGCASQAVLRNGGGQQRRTISSGGNYRRCADDGGGDQSAIRGAHVCPAFLD
jgi:hypothetical protein